MRIKYNVCIRTMHKCWIMYEYAGRIYVYLFGRMEWFDMRKKYWWLCWSMQKRCNMHRFGKRLSLCLRQRFHGYVTDNSLSFFFSFSLLLPLWDGFSTALFRVFIYLSFHFVAISIKPELPLINIYFSYNIISLFKSQVLWESFFSYIIHFHSSLFSSQPAKLSAWLSLQCALLCFKLMILNY